MAKMFRKRTKSDAQTEYTCSVRFLDDEPTQFTFKKDTIGQWLFDRVAEKLNLMEKDYFGLRFVDSEKQRHWLDPLKTVYKQLKGINPMVLCFRVKFYPEDPMKLHEEITRYYLFLQLRRDLHHGRLLCSPDDAVSLAALIVQSEVGDYDPEEHPPGYISEFKTLPKQSPKLEERVMEQHKLLHGQVPADAEGNFLRKACTLDTYGVDPHQVKDQKGDQLYLGITHQGIMTFRGSRRTQLYKWAQIRRIAYEGKMFVVTVNVNEDDEAGTTKKKQQPVGYKCQTAAAAKYLWRCAVEQQLFFTLSNSNTAPKKMRSGGTLFSRGSKFRFSGRCQNEAYEASEHIHRSEPNFQRSSSLPNFARRHPSQGSRNSVVNKRDSTVSDTQPDDRRRYNVIWASGKTPEAAVDVPGLTEKAAAAVEPSPMLKAPSVSDVAPMATPENYDEKQQQQVVEEAAPKLNGQAVTLNGDADTSFETTSYQPNNTFYDDDDDEDEGPKPSLEEEIEQLDRSFSNTEPNHTPTASQPTARPTATAVQKKSSRCGACSAVLGSVVMAISIFGILFYVLYFSGLEHPFLTEARNHLTFLEPARVFVAEQAKVVATYFKK